MEVYLIFEIDERFYNNEIFIKVVDSEEKAKQITKEKEGYLYEKWKVE